MIGDENTKICGSKSVKCYQMAEKRLYEHLNNDTVDEDAQSFYEQCDCLYGCHAIEFDTIIDRASFTADIQKNSYDIPIDFIEWVQLKFDSIRRFQLILIHSVARYHYSNMEISASNLQMETIKQTAFSTRADFLANCGGLLGLFLGFSVLSISKWIINFVIHLIYLLRKVKSTNAVSPDRHN